MLSNLKRTTRECVHYRSRDKDGGHTIRSATAENPMLYARKLHGAKEPELLSIDVLHCRKQGISRL